MPPAEPPAPALAVRVTLPDWVGDVVRWDEALGTEEARMRLAVRLAGENVERGTGGPFGAVVAERDTGRLVSVGVNRVVPLGNSALHAEVVALMLAQARVGSFTLGAPGMPAYELATSCDPCAMCLGATLWSGVKFVRCGATRDDAMLLRFEEGPVFASSWAYLRRRGIDVRHGVLREEALAVFDRYRALGGAIYNG